jgi:transcriptional regulator with XRE-family HTH domain
MTDTNNRIRQARRHARLSQQALATRVGVHRSAVAQWEQPGGPHPTMEHTALIALSTAVSFEWLATGRGRMAYASNLVPGEETPAVLIEFSAQDETEERGLAAMRKLDFPAVLALVELMEALAHARQMKVGRRTAYSR